MVRAEYRAGYAAIVGRPNVGKSTFLNRVIGQKLSITSHKPQTTRHQLMGIHTTDRAQIVFVDTPGIHKGRKKALNRYLNRAAISSLDGVDVAIFMIQGKKLTQDDRKVLQILEQQAVPVIAAVNKVDQVENKEQLFPVLQELGELGGIQEIFPISALKGTNVAELVSAVESRLPESVPIFPADQITDRPLRFFAGEIIREKLTRRLNQELPYGCTVLIEKFDESEKQILIHAMICVEKESQKGIVIGKGGQMLKDIGREARLDLNKLLMRSVHLELWVKVKGGWTDDIPVLQELGYLDR